MPDWKNTRLWQLLTEGFTRSAFAKNASRLASHLELMMPDIVAVLGAGETAPADFTLHDEGHGFRVAERMVDTLTPACAENLSPTEAALLLLSAHLHDIGMTPKRGKVRAHHEYLLTGTAAALSERERAELQRWLDDHADGLVPPLASGPLTVNDLRRADLLITHYARSRHNDWSEEWIREHLASRPDLYAGWIDDLVQLCRSHHYGYDELVKEKFDPKVVGPSDPPELVHLRFLAAVLRIADILEFDPERTPEVILQHRDVSAESVLYWEKDHQVALLRQGNTLIFQARPCKAAIHRAIEIMADEIDTELELCLRLKNENRFGSAALGPSYPIPHEWTLEKMHRNIVPREGAYEYVDGSFRPNTARILQLLSGTSLYQDPLAATRELIQNAFDAVREKIAWQRLTYANSASRCLERTLGDMNSVVLELKQMGDEAWLECTDTGVGMTKSVLTNQFLISGSPRSHKLLDLERRCRAKGFGLGRTGEFGIGALSYFMIANRVIIETRRSQEPGDLELNGWRFTSDGIGSFGELQKIDRAPGTTVRLRLEPGIVKRLDAWFDELLEYLVDIILVSPCKFELHHNGARVREWPAGWAETTDALTRRFLRRLESAALDLSGVSSIQRERLLGEAKSREASLCVARESLRWQEWELDIVENFGHCRALLPWFELPEGRSLVLWRLSSEGDRFSIADEISHDPSTRHAWKGILADVELDGLPAEAEEEDYRPIGWIRGVDTTWNWLKSARVSISRSKLSLDDEVRQAISTVRSRLRPMVHEWVLDTLKPSPFLARSCFNVGAAFRKDTPVWWRIRGDGPTLVHEPLLAQDLQSDAVRTAFRWRGRSVPVVVDELASRWNPPHYVVPDDSRRPVAIWDFTKSQNDKRITFPDPWRRLTALILSSFTVIGNHSNGIGRTLGWQALGSTRRDHDSIRSIRRAVNDRSEEQIVIWLAYSAWYSDGDEWLFLREQEPTVAADAWRILSQTEDAALEQIAFADTYDQQLVVFSENGVEAAVIDSDLGRQWMPDPGPEWTVKPVE
jgi:hypothetical protein